MRNLVILAALVVTLGVLGFLFQSQTNLPESEMPRQKDVPSEIKPEQAIDCSGELTPELTEGPYYKVGSRERTNIRGNSTGEKLTVTGLVLDQNCEPIKGAWLDFWQADGNGNYDNAGYNLRGHQFTNEDGKYTLETVLPARYSGRTPHIHVKARATESSPTLTSQLYFPNQEQNARDSIFNKALVVDIEEVNGTKTATFNFVIPQK